MAQYIPRAAVYKLTAPIIERWGMKVTELVEIMEVFEATGLPVSLFFGAHEVNKDAVAAKSTACPTPGPQ